MNPLSERYRLLEEDTRDSWAMLEAVESGPRIIFRSGRSCAGVIGWLAAALLVAMVASCALVLSERVPTPWKWMVYGVFILPVAWVLGQARSMGTAREHR